MKTEKRLIEFVKWLDPLDQDMHLTNEDDDDEKEEARDNKLKKGIGTCIVGPMGIIPINEHNRPSKIYNFWMMHTNFNISAKVVDQLKVIDGIEILSVYTRYRARFAVGKTFNQNEVMDRIRDAICREEAPKSEIPGKTYWALVVKDGKTLTLQNVDKDLLEKKLQEYADCKITKSWEKNNAK